MRTVWPHEFFRLDFDQILEEGRRQEQIHPANKGEYALVRNMHTYFDCEVLPLVASNNWVFEAASVFATEYALDCFHCLRLSGQEAYRTQRQLLKLNEEAYDLLARAYLAGAAPLAGEATLPKASDFLGLLELTRLPPQMLREAQDLHEKVIDHEVLQLKVTLRGIREAYETTLPRVMHVVRRAIKVKLRLPPQESDNELRGISEEISWYAARVTAVHPLSPVLGELRAFYKVARNVASHHKGLEWHPSRDEVELVDGGTVVRMHVHKFQQKYRHLIHVCDLGLRGILSAFCERERGSLSNELVREYAKTFPEDFPQGEQGRVRLYPT